MNGKHTDVQSPLTIKILAVDDRTENLMALSAALCRNGYDVMEAHSGLEALELVKHHDFAVILLDVQMPAMDGFETASKIRKETPASSTPIIFLTALHKSELYENKGYIVGAVDYLFKPLNIEILKAKIAVFVELYRKNAECLRQAELLKKAALRDQELALLKETTRIKEDFLAMAAHELKTPLTPLNLQTQAFIQMYKNGTFKNISEERILRLLGNSQTQINRLSRLVDELSDVVKMTSGVIQLQKDPVELRGLVENIVDSFNDESLEKKCEISTELDPEIVGHWDGFRIEQILTNLISNAMKYGAGKPIEISAHRVGQKAVLAVQDYGIGISEQDHVRIFERFERAASAKHYSGLGIGLFVVNNIVKLHGGSVTVKSNLGEGARFTVELPLN